jgi:hypothetical protein
MPLRAVEKFAIDADVVNFGIGLASQLRDHLAVYGDESAADDLFGLTAGSDSGGGDNFLQTFNRHEWIGQDAHNRAGLNQSAQSRILEAGWLPLYPSPACRGGWAPSRIGGLAVLPGNAVVICGVERIRLGGYHVQLHFDNFGLGNVSVETGTGLAMFSANSIVCNRTV